MQIISALNLKGNVYFILYLQSVKIKEIGLAEGREF